MRSRTSNIPDEVNYDQNINTKWDTAWGVATTGIQIYNGLAAENIDPFYPAKYSKMWFPDHSFYDVDKCLAHP